MRKITAILLIFVMIFSVLSCGRSAETKGVDQGETKVIAHRGLSGLEVENTDRAFAAAGERSYYGIEADIRRTGDGKFVICHDEDLKRVAGVDVKVEETDFADLMDVVLLNKNGKKDEDVGSLSTLESFISICQRYEKQAILELKSNFTSDEVTEILSIIDSLGYLDKTTFISFDYDNLLYVRAIYPEQSAMYLFSKLDDENVERLYEDKIDVAIKHTALTKSALREFHEAGLKVNCWTVDSKARAEKLISWGVDYLTTNILE